MNTVKFLPVNLDKQLPWSDMLTTYVNNVANYSVFFTVKDLLSSYYLHILYCFLILPYMIYGCEIRRNNFDCESQKVVTLQKRLLRLIAKS